MRRRVAAALGATGFFAVLVAACSSWLDAAGGAVRDAAPGGDEADGGAGLPDAPFVPPYLDGDCDPIAPSRCGLPFPSNVYTRVDPTSPTGIRVSFGAGTLPSIGDGTDHMSPSFYEDLDGFSPMQAPFTHLPGATLTGLPKLAAVADSIHPTSPTILLEADTGALIPHFDELDMSGKSPDDDDQRVLLLRPVVRLRSGTRYIVAIRHVVDAAGHLIAAAPAFAALRDGTDSAEASVGLRRDLYADIFARLQRAGVDTQDLQIAWDYTTASDVGLTSALIAMRDDALARVGKDGPKYKIAKSKDSFDPRIALRIEGTFETPFYLESPLPGAPLRRDATGRPMARGTASWPFLVYIPVSATTWAPAPLLQNGHGLLDDHTQGGDPTKANDDYLLEIANTKNYVVFAVDWSGLASPDLPYVLSLCLGDAGEFRRVIDRLHQGIVNALLAMRMMKGAFSRDPATVINGQATIDPTQAYYRGDSQGGILGTTYLALSPDVSRGLLGATGMGYDLMLQRSADFKPFFTLLGTTYPDLRDQQIVIGLLAMLWDHVEGTAFAEHVLVHPIADTPPKQVLIHVAIGDYQVPSLAGEILARTIGVKNTATAPRPIFQLDEVAAPFPGSAIVEWDFGIPDGATNVPSSGAKSLDPHPKLRTLPASQTQTDTFFRTGTIDMTACGGGPCRGS